MPLRLFLRIVCKRIGETEWGLAGQGGFAMVEGGPHRLATDVTAYKTNS